MGDFTDWKRRPAIPVLNGQPVTLTLPRGAWVEYAWLDGAGHPFPDPDNDRRSLNPWWTYPRAAVNGHYEQHPLSTQTEDVPSGTAHRLSWEGGVFGGTRRAIVYTPPHYDPAVTYPVYYVQDGVAFYRTGKLGELMDRALAAHLIDPAVLVFVEPGDRNEEYYLNDRYLDFLTGEVWPRVEGQYSVARDAAGRGLWARAWAASSACTWGAVTRSCSDGSRVTPGRSSPTHRAARRKASTPPPPENGCASS